MVRLHYVDNLRWIAVMVVLLLHAACIFTGDFFVFAKDVSLPGLLLIFSIFAWIMPLMFCLAGLSTKFALQKRSPTMYLKERVTRLLVPFLAGMVLISPVMGYIALKFHTGFTGSYTESFVHFFTTSPGIFGTNGYTGDYSMQHLWFIIFLFIISVVALGVILLGQWQTWIHLNPDKVSLPVLILAFIPICLLNYLEPYISGASLQSYFIMFLIGYYLFSRDTIQNLLEKHRKLLLISWVVLTIAFLTGGMMGHLELCYGTSPLNCLAGWMGVLALMGTGKHLIDTTSSFSAYMGAASYPVYIIHLPIMVAIAYYVLMLAISPVVQFLVILIGSFLLTFACYEILKRIPVVRALFGIAGPRKKSA